MTYYVVVTFEYGPTVSYGELEATSFSDAVTEAEKRARDIPRQLKVRYGRIKDIKVEKTIS